MADKYSNLSDIIKEGFNSTKNNNEKFPSQDEGFRLVRAFLRISDPKARGLIIQLTEIIGETMSKER